jgi:hypothetical protein
MHPPPEEDKARVAVHMFQKLHKGRMGKPPATANGARSTLGSQGAPRRNVVG